MSLHGDFRRNLNTFHYGMVRKTVRNPRCTRSLLMVENHNQFKSRYKLSDSLHSSLLANCKSLFVLPHEAGQVPDGFRRIIM
jgi:hypothetical protein